MSDWVAAAHAWTQAEQTKSIDTQPHLRILLRTQQVVLEALCSDIAEIGLTEPDEALNQEERRFLRRTRTTIGELGEIRDRDGKQRFTFEESLRGSLRILAVLCGAEDVVDLKMPHLHEATGIRNRITHPRHDRSYGITNDDLNVVDWAWEDVWIAVRSVLENDLPGEAIAADILRVAQVVAHEDVA